MKINNLLKLISTTHSSAGYTLAELLIAASLTLLVVGASGFGVTAMIQGNKTAKAEIERRTEVNRALDFISDEVRYAKTVGADASGITGFDPTGKTVVMVLDTSSGQKTVYYAKSNAGTNWVGPQVLYRWGPPLNADGSYGTGSNTSQALIDRVDDAASTPNCATGWSASPSSDAKGFYACIAPTGPGGTKMAQLNLIAQFNSTDKYTATTNVFARAGSDSGAGGSSAGSLVSANPTGCTVVSGILSCPSTGAKTKSKTRMTFKVIGAKYACNAQSLWNVKTEATILDSKNVPIPSTSAQPNPLVFNSSSAPPTLDVDTDPADPNDKQTVKIASVPENSSGALCNNEGNKIESTNTAQVKALKNGDSVPNVAGFQGQESVVQSLNQYIENGKIKIDPNQIIYLFEIGQTDTGLTGFDMQDNIVLVTIDPPSS